MPKLVMHCNGLLVGFSLPLVNVAAVVARTSVCSVFPLFGFSFCGLFRPLSSFLRFLFTKCPNSYPYCCSFFGFLCVATLSLADYHHL